jgi:hypothetical protein
MNVVTSNKQQSSLQTIFSIIRKEIIRSISINLPKGSLALGPVLFFIEDCEQRCLYNWSNVTWEELKLGNFLRGVLRDIKDVTKYCLNHIPDTSVKKSFEDIHTKCKKLLDSEIDDKFDNWPVFVSEYSNFREFIDNFGHSFKQIPEYVIEDIERLDVSQVDIELLPDILGDIYKINEGRFSSLDELRVRIGKADNEQLDLLKNFILKHPKYNNVFSEAEKAVQRWNEFRIKIKAFDKNNIDHAKQHYESLMKTAIELFCDLPQEVLSSDSYDKLKKINTEMYLKRSDITAIRLFDLIYHPFPASYKIENLKKYKLYYITHFFERLFYIPSEQTTKESVIKNIIIFPIKYFDAQVIGQIVIISPEPIPRQLVINSVEAYLPKIREAAIMDFEAGIFMRATKDASKTSKAIMDESKYLFDHLNILLTYGAMAILKWNQGANSWELVRKTQIDIEVNDKYFISWIGNKTKSMSGKIKYSVASINKPEKKSLFNSAAIKIESCFIGIAESKWEKHALTIFFIEPVDVMKRSASEIYLSIAQALNKLSPIKEKQLLDRDKIAIMHNTPKDLSVIKDKLQQIKIELKKPSSINHIETALNALVNYEKGIMAVTKSSFDEYGIAEGINYKIDTEIKVLTENYILIDQYIEHIKDKISRGYGSAEYATTLNRLWKTKKAAILDLELESHIVNINKSGLTFLIDNLIKNAFDHTDWNYFKDKENSKKPIAVLRCKKVNHNIVIQIANIPGDKDFKSHFYNMFYGKTATPHLSMISKVFGALSGGNHIVCEADDREGYIRISLSIPQGGL